MATLRSVGVGEMVMMRIISTPSGRRRPALPDYADLYFTAPPSSSLSSSQLIIYPGSKSMKSRGLGRRREEITVYHLIIFYHQSFYNPSLIKDHYFATLLTR